MKIKNLKLKINQKGFTLIELLIVITIIAILIASATYSWQNAQQKGRDGKRKSDVKAVQQALEFYYQKNGKYPDASSGTIRCNVGVAGDVNWGSAFNCDSTNYMQQLPKDPAYQTTDDGYYYITPGANPVSYALWTKLENTNDPELPPKGTLPAPCTSAPLNGKRNQNFCVVNP